MTYAFMPPLPDKRRTHQCPPRMLPHKAVSADADARVKAVRADLDRRGTERPESIDRRRTVEVSPLAEVDRMYESNKWRF